MDSTTKTALNQRKLSSDHMPNAYEKISALTAFVMYVSSRCHQRTLPNTASVRATNKKSRPSSFCSVYSAVRPMSVRATLRTINGWPNCFRYLSLSFHPCTDSLFQLVSALRSLHLKAEACSRKNSPQQNGILVQGHYPNSQ